MTPGTTVVFSEVIDRQSVSGPIVREIRDGWTTINDTAFLTDVKLLSHCVLQKSNQLGNVEGKSVG
jgi:hypothetical protein